MCRICASASACAKLACRAPRSGCQPGSNNVLQLAKHVEVHNTTQCVTGCDHLACMAPASSRASRHSRRDLCINNSTACCCAVLCMQCCWFTAAALPSQRDRLSCALWSVHGYERCAGSWLHCWLIKTRLFCWFGAILAIVRACCPTAGRRDAASGTPCRQLQPAHQHHVGPP
jgi:hypothetical protein